MIFSILIFLLVLSFLVLIHELGHFLMARRFGIKVEEFGFGYPPRVLTLFTWKGIPFTLNALPFGGFVRMEGEDGSARREEPHSAKASRSKGKETMRVASHIEVDHSPFYTKTKLQRLIVILAGATVNFLFGVLAFIVLFYCIGIPVSKTPPVVEQVFDGPAKTAGVQVGDVIEEVGKQGSVLKPAGELESFIRFVAHEPNTILILHIQRGTQTLDIPVHTRSARDIALGQGALGVSLDQPVDFVHYAWYEMPFRSIVVGVQKSVDFSFTIVDTLESMIKNLVTFGMVPKDVAGPVGIVKEVNDQHIFDGGVLAILNFTAILSINLAIMNVLPFPALDGGRAVLIILEAIVGRKRVAKVEGLVNTAGFALLLTLIVAITAKDIWTIFH